MIFFCKFQLHENSFERVFQFNWKVIVVLCNFMQSTRSHRLVCPVFRLPARLSSQTPLVTSCWRDCSRRWLWRDTPSPQECSRYYWYDDRLFFSFYEDMLFVLFYEIRFLIVQVVVTFFSSRASFGWRSSYVNFTLQQVRSIFSDVLIFWKSFSDVVTCCCNL